MHEALEDGFLRARNGGTKFALMWTNHPWLTLFPTVHVDGTRSFPHARDAPSRPEDIWRSFSYLISRYLHHPDYWRIDGKPVLVVWDSRRLVATFRADGTRRLLDGIVQRVHRPQHAADFDDAEQEQQQCGHDDAKLHRSAAIPALEQRIERAGQG